MDRQATRLVRTAMVLAGAGLGLVLAGPAGAHVEVSAEGAEPGDRDVVLIFTGQSESDTAGVVSLRVVLPDGIAAGEVSLVDAPPGWQLGVDEDPAGFTVAGPELPVGEAATVSVRVAQLPADAAVLEFRSLQTYADGRVDRFIDLAEQGDNRQFPAPLLNLAPTATPTGAAAADSGAGPAAASPGGGAGWWPLVLVAAAAATVAVLVLVRQRRGTEAGQ